MSFKEKVYAIVKQIPPGQTLTYKEVAQLADSPQAFRAVGNALNKNPDPLNIPCHRVIRSDGKTGGYKWGVHNKQFLLKQEKQSKMKNKDFTLSFNS